MEDFFENHPSVDFAKREIPVKNVNETVKPEVPRHWETFKISVGMAKLTNYVSLQSTCFVNNQCFVVLRKEAS